MNKELIIEALEALKKTVEFQMDANDAHFSTFYVTKCNEISEEINKLNTNTNG
jgi:hypothetical protein